MPAVERLDRWTPSLVTLTLASALVLSVCMGLRQSMGLFMAPMARDIGVSASEFGFALAIQNLAWGVTQPFIGSLADRYGSKLIITMAGPTYAVGLLVMAFFGGWGLTMGGGLIVGLAVSGSAFGVVIGAVSRSAPASKRGLAVAIVSAVGSIGTFVIAPLGQFLIENTGWKISLICFACIAVIISVAGLAINERSTGNQQTPETDPTKAFWKAVNHKGFMAMTLAFFACRFQLVFITTHLPGYLDFCGVPPSISARALALIGVFNAIGTLSVGLLGSRFGNGFILSLVYLLRTIAIVVYVSVPVSTETTLVFAASMGLLWLSVVPLVSALINSIFGSINFGTLFGVMFFSHQIGSFLGAWLGGLSVDVTGNYTLAWWSLIIIGAIAFLLQYFADTSPAEHEKLITV